MSSYDRLLDTAQRYFTEFYTVHPNHLHRLQNGSDVPWTILDRVPNGVKFDNVTPLLIRVPHCWASLLADLQERSNYRALWRDFHQDPGLVRVETSLYVNLKAASNALLEAVDSLFDFGTYDDADYVQLEIDTEANCWDRYGRDLLRYEMQNHGYDLNQISNSDLDTAWRQTCEDWNITPEWDGPEAYWPDLADRETAVSVASNLVALRIAAAFMSLDTPDNNN